MIDGKIPDENIQASSTKWPSDHPAWRARLNGNSYWVGEGEQPWIQADVGYQSYVSGVMTQGDGGVGDYPDWVTSIKVSTFSVNTNDTEVFIKNCKEDEMV